MKKSILNKTAAIGAILGTGLAVGAPANATVATRFLPALLLRRNADKRGRHGNAVL